MSENPELDKVLHAQDRKLAVGQFFESIGCTHGQAEIASRALAENFVLTGATLMFNGRLAKDAVDDVVAHLRRQDYGCLLPPETPDLTRTAVDPALLDKAFAGSGMGGGRSDARLEVYKRLGRDRQKFDDAARTYGLKSADDYHTNGVKPGTASDDDGKSKRPNPWADGSFNLTEIGRIVKSNPTLAASLAASAGKDISGRPLRRAS